MYVSVMKVMHEYTVQSGVSSLGAICVTEIVELMQVQGQYNVMVIGPVSHDQNISHECPHFQSVRTKYHFLFHLCVQSMSFFFSQQDRQNAFRFISDCLDMVSL